jgi:hypothetical protein
MRELRLFGSRFFLKARRELISFYISDDEIILPESERA